jgi:hypothetical protein
MQSSSRKMAAALRNAEIAEKVAAGWNFSSISRAHGLSKAVISRIIKQHFPNLIPKRGRPRGPIVEDRTEARRQKRAADFVTNPRHIDILARRNAGETLAEIRGALGLSRERVRRIEQQMRQNGCPIPRG